MTPWLRVEVRATTVAREKVGVRRRLQARMPVGGGGRWARSAGQRLPRRSSSGMNGGGEAARDERGR
jgi:hypothetical protein